MLVAWIKWSLFISTVCAIDGYFEPKYITQINVKDLGSHTIDPDYVVVLLIYDIFNYKSIYLGEAFFVVFPKLKNYVKFIAISCEHNEEFCTDEIKSELPLIQFYIPKGLSPLTKKPIVEERIYMEDINPFIIINLVESFVPFLGDLVDEEYIETFLSYENNKVLLFSKEEEIIIQYKALCSKFRGRLEFGVVYINQTALVERFKVYRFPSMVVVKGQEVIHYDGFIDFPLMSDFLDKYKSEERKKLRIRRLLNESYDQDQLAHLPEFDIINVNSQNYTQVLNEDSELALMHIYKDNSSDFWKILHFKYGGAVKFLNFRVDSEEDLAAVSEIGAKKLPSIRIFPGNRKRKSFEASIGKKEELEEEIRREMKSDVSVLSDGGLSVFIKTVNTEKKVGFVFISQTNIPVQIKALAKVENFKHFSKFGMLGKNREEAEKQFNIKRYPSFIALVQKGNGMRILEYQGLFSDYRALYYFINDLAIPELVPKEIEIPDPDELEDVAVIKNADQFSAKCLKRGVICFILFYSNYDKILKNALSMAQQYSMTRKFNINIVAINGECQKNMLTDLNLEKQTLPVFLGFNAAKSSALAFDGKLEYHQIVEFIFNVLRENIKTQRISIPEFKNDCDRKGSEL